MFEVESLKYATLATVSRCGMVWFSDDTVTPALMIDHQLQLMASRSFDDVDEDVGAAPVKAHDTQIKVVKTLRDLIERDDFLLKALDQASLYKHIMEFTVVRVLDSFFSLLSKTCRNILQYNAIHPELPLDQEQTEAFVAKKLLLATVWGLVGDASLSIRKSFGDYISTMTSTDLPTLDESMSLIDYNVSLPQGQWIQWQSQVPSIEVNTHSITQTDVIVPTVDT
ncbi:MAG: hypothetical protein M1823_007311, partial [Watsoniomyces obsoletus]